MPWLVDLLVGLWSPDMNDWYAAAHLLLADIVVPFIDVLGPTVEFWIQSELYCAWIITI